jgi:copper homeostasis protein
MAKVLEVCVDSIRSIQVAEAAGAHRVELCAALSEGGLTPSIGMIRAAVKATSLPVFVIIRPRSGDFLYDEIEFSVRFLCCQGKLFTLRTLKVCLSSHL